MPPSMQSAGTAPATRFAIQKARGKGWTTLEVGEERPQAEARFALMVKLNPRAYFRLIELELNPDSAYEGMEFNWKLLQLHDPSQRGGRRGAGAAAAARPRARRTKEKVPLPLRVYLGVVLAGALIGLAVYLALGPSVR